MLAVRTIVLLGVLSAATVSAQSDDGVYRRWDTDLAVAVGAGGGVVFPGADADIASAVVVEARLRIIDTAGPVVSYRWSGDAGGYLFLGVELRPLWPALFLVDQPTGIEWLDLFIQSFGVEVGAVILPLGDPDGADVDLGVGLGIGLAIEVPLIVPSRMHGAARGLFLRLAARRVDATARFRASPDRLDMSEWSLSATLQMSLGGNAGADNEPRRWR